VALMLNVRVVLLLPSDEGLTVQAGFPPDDLLDGADIAAAKWVWQNNKPAGRGADTLPGGKRLFLPMQTGRGPIGVFGIDRDGTGPMLTPDGDRLLSFPTRPRWPSNASIWCAMSIAHACRQRRTVCAPPCSPPSRMICARRSPPFSAR
jgi:hypothetical protein